MKNIFLISALLFSITASADDVQLQELKDCIGSLSARHYSWGDTYSSVLSSDSNEKKNSLLVVTNKGAQVVEGADLGDGAKSTFVFSFTGKKEELQLEIWKIQNGKASGGWTGVGHSPVSKTKVLSTPEAIKFAGSGLLTREDQKMSEIETVLKSLDSSIRMVDGGPFKEATPTAYNMVNEEKLQFMRQIIDKKRDELKTCDQLPNDDVKKAAQIERNRLSKMQDQLDLLSKEASSVHECVKEKMKSYEKDQ
ncbi:MAG TPA: hypothetical protein VN132_00500, partial [Bdellovibrio sp.]|nr:hypothetical protein [Bdellovibrio sp.]